MVVAHQETCDARCKGESTQVHGHATKIRGVTNTQHQADSEKEFTGTKKMKEEVWHDYRSSISKTGKGHPAQTAKCSKHFAGTSTSQKSVWATKNCSRIMLALNESKRPIVFIAGVHLRRIPIKCPRKIKNQKHCVVSVVFHELLRINCGC